jgi:hypothetical protein
MRTRCAGWVAVVTAVVVSVLIRPSTADARRYVEAPDDVPFEVVIQPGGHPLVRPALVARNLATNLARHRARIVRMTYLTGEFDPDTGEHFGSRLWVVRAVGRFTVSTIGGVARSNTAYWTVDDGTGMIVGFGMP